MIRIQCKKQKKTDFQSFLTSTDNVVHNVELSLAVDAAHVAVAVGAAHIAVGAAHIAFVVTVGITISITIVVVVAVEC